MRGLPLTPEQSQLPPCVRVLSVFLLLNIHRDFNVPRAGAWGGWRNLKSLDQLLVRPEEWEDHEVGVRGLSPGQGCPHSHTEPSAAARVGWSPHHSPDAAQPGSWSPGLWKELLPPSLSSPGKMVRSAAAEKQHLYLPLLGGSSVSRHQPDGLKCFMMGCHPPLPLITNMQPTGVGTPPRLLLQGRGGHIQMNSDHHLAVYRSFPEQVLCCCCCCCC